MNSRASAKLCGSVVSETARTASFLGGVVFCGSYRPAHAGSKGGKEGAGREGVRASAWLEHLQAYVEHHVARLGTRRRHCGEHHGVQRQRGAERNPDHLDQQFWSDSVPLSVLAPVLVRVRVPHFVSV